MIKRIAAVLATVLLVFCIAIIGTDRNSAEGEPLVTYNSKEQCETAKEEILNTYNNTFSGRTEKLMSAEFLNWIEQNFGTDSVMSLYSKLKDGTYTEEAWYDITGCTVRVLQCYYKGELDPDSPDYREDIRKIDSNGGDTVIRVTGDFSLADNWKIMPEYDQRGKGLEGVLSADTIKLLQSADITLVNNEFTYSTRGEPLANKYYTFRAHPDRVSIFNELGVDIVSLANNHAYDYGPDAFLDTMATLDDAGIAYIGGGKNLEEAKKPFYFIVNGRMIGFTAATKAEKYRLTPEATDTTPGVLRTYDPTNYLEVIAAAEAECDYNIAYVHWGLEGSHEIEDGLRTMGARLIDAGADIVIGAHAHLLQGVEYYNGKPIVYNLGNFLFNAKTMDSGILEITITENGDVFYKFIPCIQSGCYTEAVTGDEAERILNFMASMSNGVSFDQNGVFTENITAD